MKLCATAITALCIAAASPSHARIVRVEIAKVEPAFGGRTFETVGPYEHVVGRAYGEVDPAAAVNVPIQDIALAPRNARGLVEYATDIDILRPADPAKSNDVLLFNVLNRGNKGALALFNADVPGVSAQINRLDTAGDGWLQQQGTTLIWWGWQADVLPGGDRMTLQVPVARAADGSNITGLVRDEIVVLAPASSVNLSTGYFTGLITNSYPPVSTDNRTPLADGFRPTLTVRPREDAPRVAIPNANWSFASCPAGGAVTPSEKQICLAGGFQPGQLYELIYRARDPSVMGLGYAVTRDLGTFLRDDARDAAGASLVAHGPRTKLVIMGTSQSGRMIRSLIMLGFNKGEDGRQVFDAALPHIGGGLMPLSLRFAQPGRAWGEEIDHLYPAYDFPFAYGRQQDPMTGREAGILDRCTAEANCPLIVHAATALEVWEARQSLGLTDPLGLRDAVQPENVRVYIMASTQHAPPDLPLPTQPPFGLCKQQQNPNPHTWTMRALLAGLVAWVQDGQAPPPSTTPRIDDGTLVAPDAVRFPAIPATNYGGTPRPAMTYLGTVNRLHTLDFGPDYKPAVSGGIISREPPGIGTGSYNVLVPQVDADGIDLAGVRDVYVQAPIGTYTGWNTFRAGRYDDGFCIFSGSFNPFAATKAEREAAGDPRSSIEERYPEKGAYVAAIRRAADSLVAQHLMLREDAGRVVAEAERDGVRKGP